MLVYLNADNIVHNEALQYINLLSIFDESVKVKESS